MRTQKLLSLAATLTVMFTFACASAPHSNKEVTSGGPKAIPNAAATNPSTPVTDSASVNCKKGKDERKISNLKNVGGGCEVSYTKFGKSEVVANAEHDLAHCANIVDRIQKKLEQAGYSCK